MEQEARLPARPEMRRALPKGQSLEILSGENLQQFKTTERVMGVREREDSEWIDFSLGMLGEGRAMY